MDVAGYTGPVGGHTTSDALRILSDELEREIRLHENKLRNTSFKDSFVHALLHHSNKQSVLHWTSIVIIVLVAVLLFVCYALQSHRDNWLVVEAFLLLVILAMNCYVVGWDQQLREAELANKARTVLEKVQESSKKSVWTASNYVNLHAPLAPCVTLQWTMRDSDIVNLPCALLVEGDIIMLRPGQVVPAKCRQIQDNGDGVQPEYKAGEIYNPDNEETNCTFTQPAARAPLKPQPFLLLETPFLQNLRLVLQEGNNRPVSVLNNERYQVCSIIVEKRILPCVLVIVLLTNVLRLVFLGRDVGHWAEMIILLQVHAVLPLLPLVLPVVWILLDVYGVTRVLTAIEKVEKKNGSAYNGFDTESNMSELSVVSVEWREMWEQFKSVLWGKCNALSRTSSVAQVLGNVTSLCCIDKKGILSWPNPTAEKVFFLRNDTLSKEDSKNSSSQSMDQDSGSVHTDNDNDSGSKDLASSKETKHTQDFQQESSFQVLDLTQDPKNGYGLQFDELSWKKYINSLKPLGLNILLNTCNLQTAERYTEFADHLVCMALKREETVPVVNRRCFCELARQIGFSEQAASIFELQQTLAMYRHVECAVASKDMLIPSRSFIKHKMPMPNMFTVVEKDVNTGCLQLMSQGTADMLLDSCSEYWDGFDLCPLTDIERKKILDFYHRTSMSSYCTAFSYRPLSRIIGKEMESWYIEVPDDRDTVYPTVKSPTPTRSWDVQSLDSRVKQKEYFGGSADSLMTTHSTTSVHDIEHCFQTQCNQVFIGMITMQYQAKLDIVQLIEDLETACIRFVHFSKENELRSRVFSEKMGLEAGWNCHVSLLSEKTTDSLVPNTHPESCHSDGSNRQSRYSSRHSADISNSKENVSQKGKRAKELSKTTRRSSAPGALSLDTLQVKFEGDDGSEFSSMQTPSTTHDSPSKLSPVGEATSSSPMRHYTSPASMSKYRHREQKFSSPVSDSSEENSPRVTIQSLLNTTSAPDHMSLSSSRHSTPRRSTSVHTKAKVTSEDDPQDLDPDLTLSDPSEPLLRGRGSAGSTTQDRSRCHSPTADSNSIDANGEAQLTDNLSSAGSYPASSHVTENTDSVTGGLGLSNRAKLPKGIENIRPHIDNVDNVPLLVSLFTDCTPETARDMLKILQEYGEVVCCVGSSASTHNCGSFIQADCSLAMEPVYPEMCICQPPIAKPWADDCMGPMELSTLLNSIPCCLAWHRDEKISILRLIAEARDHCRGVRNSCLFLMMCALSLTLLQVLCSIFHLPPLLASQHLLWLVCVALPLLAITMVGTPLDPHITTQAPGKNRNHVTKENCREFTWSYLIQFLPSVIICLVCHGTTLSGFCHLVAVPENATCHIFWGHWSYGVAYEWNGWGKEYASGLNLSQNLVACQIFIYFVCISVSFVHRYHHVWHKCPFVNKLWCLMVPILLVVQVLYCVIDIAVHNLGPGRTFYLSEVPYTTWVMMLMWPLFIIPINELVKYRQAKLFARYQKRARLDFGTKLGMNSPF